MSSVPRIPSAYVLVGTPADFGDALPFRLSPRVVLRRASALEIASIRRYLGELSSVYPCTQIFEYNFKKEVGYAGNIGDSPEIIYQRPTRLPPERWRYSVVAVARYEWNPFGEDYSDLIQLRTSSQLSFCPLFLNTATARRVRHSLDFAADWHHYTNPTDAEYKITTFKRRDLEDWRDMLKLLASVKLDFPAVWHSLKLFSEVPVIKGHNELTVLALFSVLESVLTHSPLGQSDSIGHQIRTKIALASKRMDLKPDYSAFGQTSMETTWRKLYELRSRIAHGSEVNFSGPLKILDDAYTVEKFMFSVVRSVLRFAVKEPELVTALKAV